MAEPEYETEHHWNFGSMWGSETYESNATHDDGHQTSGWGHSAAEAEAAADAEHDAQHSTSWF